jgi:hypothetical protein
VALVEMAKADGPVFVFTTGVYKVAQFDQHSGNFNWQRQVPAPQKAVIENWFSIRFSQVAALEAAPETKPATSTKKLTRSARA